MRATTEFFKDRDIRYISRVQPKPMEALAREMLQLLREMSLMSEVSAGSFVPVHSGKPQSKPPPGFSERLRDPLRAPQVDFSLYEHFSWRWRKSRTDLQKRVIVCQARVAVRHRKDGPDPWIVDKAIRTEREEIGLLIEMGVGVHSAELSADTGWPRSWIETQRERHGREPEYGNERPHWRALSVEERTEAAFRLFERNLSLRGAAKELGVAHTTLARYWPSQRAA
jgi:hypothetical protein